MHERDSRQKVMRVSTRLNPHKPDPLRRTDVADQLWDATGGAGQVLPPEEWGVERPRLAISWFQGVSLTDNGSNREHPYGVTVPAHHISPAGHDSLRANDALLAPVSIQHSHQAKAGLEMQARRPRRRAADLFAISRGEDANGVGRLASNRGVVPTRVIQPRWPPRLFHVMAPLVRPTFAVTGRGERMRDSGPVHCDGRRTGVRTVNRTRAPTYLNQC